MAGTCTEGNGSGAAGMAPMGRKGVVGGEFYNLQGHSIQSVPLCPDRTMLPRYNLPAIQGALPHDSDFKPKQVGAWLKRLPLSDPLQAAGELADCLDRANRAKMGHDVRARMVEQLDAAVEDTVTALRGQYAGAPLPLAPRLRPHPQLAQRLLQELATAYKILILSWLGRSFHLNKKCLPRYLQRLLLILQQVLEISFETHENVPSGVWLDLHQTYNYALRAGLGQVIPEGTKAMLSAEQIYKGVLLMAIADPYRFPQIELPWAKDLIARFNDLAEIYPAEEATGHAGLFVVEVNTDAPPRPLAWERHPTDPRWDLLLNTTELVKHLAMLAAHVKGREDPERLGLPAVARDPAYAVMLRRLKLSWGASLQRQAQRRRYMRGKELEVGFGLRSVYQLLGPVTGERHLVNAPAETPPVVMRCITVDDSMGGLALRRSGNLTAQVKVGDLVGIRQDNGQWSVGLVRWFRVPREGELFFGVQLLAPKAHPVQVRRNDTGKQYPSLLLQASPTLRQAAMLLAPPGSIEPEAPIDVRSSNGSIELRVEKRLEYTPSVEVFRIAMA